MRTILWTSLFLLVINSALANSKPASGMASWYGEEHRGRLMANGRKFDPDKLTAASWFYPLGTKVRVTLDTPGQPQRIVTVTITDRGPALRVVGQKVFFDHTYSAFRDRLDPDLAVVGVKVEPQT